MVDASWFGGVSRPIISEMVAQSNSSANRSLYHYTSSAGLLGIVSSGSLRFADATFMNDGSETLHGIMLFIEQLKRFLSDKPEVDRAFGADLERALPHAAYFMKPYIFCVSDTPDLLNQWRDYGADVVPYCIELDVASLANSNEFNFPIYVAQVIYDENYQRFISWRLIEQIYSRYKSLPAGLKVDDATKNAMLNVVATEIFFVICRFKNSGFASEKEWRFISHGVNVTQFAQPEFRVGKLGVIPYFEYRKRDQAVDKRLPITAVWVGPSPYAQTSEYGLQQLLARYGYDTVRTAYSQIPIR